ncbi:MAG TPA: hypothetical protein VHZ74_04555 [Bryobacteraceae bacterium]|nr:hypothetical protein [Bryobacteraceae bacterium]
MACPLFLPDSRPAPLSDLYGGRCSADPQASIGADLLHACNNGYARAACERATKSDSDAFRFLIQGNHGGVIDVAWSSERNHHPVAVGNLHMSGTEAPPEAAGPLEQQARVYVAAYFRQAGK